MAIPLRHIDGSSSKAQRRSKSIDSEMSARLAYALGKHVDLDDQLSDVDSTFTRSDNEDDEAFLKENDSLNSDYDTPPQQKKSRRFRVYIYTTVGIVLLIWIGALVGYLSKGYFKPHQAPPSPVASSRRITFEQVFTSVERADKKITNGEFYASHKSVEWTSSKSGHDGVFLNGKIIREDVNGTQTTIVDESNVYYPESQTRLHFQRYWISGDEEYILLATHMRKNWRYSYRATYYVYNIASQSTAPLVEEDPNAMVDHAIWSPSAAKVAYVLDHDVYVRDMSGSTERVTFDGGAQVFNGVADWVFEEEVFASSGCIWWSPSSDYLAYIHINESLVPVYSIPYYIPESTWDGPLAYPTFVDIKYPKPGYPNPVADIYVHPLGGKPWKVAYAEPLEKRDFMDDLFGFVERDGEGQETDGWGEKKLVTNVEWMGNNMVMVSETNRVSDHFRGVLVGVTTQTATVVRDEKIEEGWFEISHDMMYIPKDEANGRPYDGYIDIVERDGYNHLGYFSPLNASTPQYITGGNWEVMGGIAAFDKDTNLVYFISTKKSPVERHLYSVHLTGKDPRPLTDIETDGWYDVSFSPLAKYYQLSYGGPDVPYQSVFSTQDPKFELPLEDNDYLTQVLKKYDLPKYEYGTIKVNGFTLNYREIRPPNFDDSGQTKYPVLFHCYGGPVSQTVEKKYLLDWHRWLASEPRLEYLIVEVDGRGTGAMGRKARVGIRGKLGMLESYDQAAAASIWKKKAYVNSEKVALWGWSYGGFLTLKTIESHPGAFPYAMAVAPVTDWRYYDSIYTERYMLTPAANANGYRQSAITNTTAMGLANRFFMAHGTGDDNVHIQNSLTLMDRLTNDEIKNWDSQVFTDDDHSIVFHHGNKAVYWRLAEWLERWFGRKEIGGRIWVVDGEMLGYKVGVDGDRRD